ncbi:MAG: TetR/AcrR family transcriptional regulator [Terracidiphilus sp.]|jgi:TetR/AcrR family transcriptional regulator
MTAAGPTRTQSERADQTRARILEAAVHEFSANGLAGARTEQIAEAADVNKALLYYYFQGKEALYAAALETVAGRMASTGMRVLALECSAGERLLRFALNHFDRIYSQPVFQKLMQQEMMRFRKGESNAMSPLVEKLFRPLLDRMLAVAEEGIRSGELIPVESSQVIYAALGPNVFYFLSSPMMRLIGETNPFEPAALEFRRKAAVEFLGQAIFIDREHGARVAARVLESTPMPLGTGTESPSCAGTERPGLSPQSQFLPPQSGETEEQSAVAEVSR